MYIPSSKWQSPHPQERPLSPLVLCVDVLIKTGENYSTGLSPQGIPS